MTFLERLSSGPPITADGGTGTERRRLGCDAGPVHRAFADAGAEVVIADSILAAGLEAAAPGEGAAALAHAVGVARAFRGAASFVAASLGPAGPSLKDDTHRRPVYAALARAARDAGADVIFAETLLLLADADAALAGARAASMPIAVTFAFDGNGRGYGGLTVDDGAVWVRHARPDAAGLNCGDGPERTLEVAERLASGLGGVPLVLRPAAGEAATAASFGAFGRRAAALGARIVGGCCGTTPDHVRALAVAVAEPRGGDG